MPKMQDGPKILHHLWAEASALFDAHAKAGGTGSIVIEKNGSLTLTMDPLTSSPVSKRKSPGEKRRDMDRLKKWRKSVHPVEAQAAHTADLTPQVAESICNSGESGNANEVTEAPPKDLANTGATPSVDLDPSAMDLDSDSVGREKYHQFVFQEEEFKLCRNFSVKLHSHRACTIPNKKIDSIKACNRAPESGGIAYLSHSCRKCSNNPPLVKTAKNNLGHTTYHVHESVEKFKVCTPCSKYKTSKICTMLNRKTTQKEDENQKNHTSEEIGMDLNFDPKVMADNIMREWGWK